MTGSTTANQESELRTVTERMGAQVVHVYRDHGISGAKGRDKRPALRMYEDLHARPELRWFWSITVFVGDRSGVTTSGRVATLTEAKARFVENWQKCQWR